MKYEYNGETIEIPAIENFEKMMERPRELTQDLPSMAIAMSMGRMVIVPAFRLDTKEVVSVMCSIEHRPGGMIAIQPIAECIDNDERGMRYAIAGRITEEGGYTFNPVQSHPEEAENTTHYNNGNEQSKVSGV